MSKKATSQNQSEEEPNETSPIRNDFSISGKSNNNGAITSFNNVEESFDQDETISYATWSAKTWSKWNNTTRGLVLLLGAALIVAAIVLVISISSSSSSSSSSKNKGVLKQASSNEETSSTSNSDQDNYGVVLSIPQGQLQWNLLKSRQGRDYYAFYKIPYAKPPLSELRFESPQPFDEKWEGVRWEKEVAPQCLQKAKYSPIIEAVGEEDCLYANIYTPKLPGINVDPDAQLLPTLFYIHGGGFSDGNGSRYGAKYFLDEDAVLVTFQYRLGIFGFLSSEDGTVRGNMGMRDQIQALKWVKDNIKYFGGDPDRIMIYGNSAGAWAVNLLMVSPLTAGLFQTAISQSGITFSGTTQPKEIQLKSFEALANATGCWSRINNEQRRNRRIIKCLREQNASEIAVVRGPDIIFSPTVESYESDDPEIESDKFLPDTVYNLFKAGKVNKLTWLIGVNSAEWMSSAARNLADYDMVNNLNTNWTGYAPSLYSVSYETSTIKDTISKKSREFYFGEKDVGNGTIWNLCNILSDRDIVHGSMVQGRLMSEFGVDVFLYYMSKRPLKSYSDKALKGYPPGDYGAHHADELQYLFDYYGYPEYLDPQSDYTILSKKMVKIWVQFASTGNPGWSPIKMEQKPIYWYELNDKMGPTTVLQERMEFWNQFSLEDLCYT